MVKKIIERIIDTFTEDTSKLSVKERLERLEESRDRMLFMQTLNIGIFIYLFLKLIAIA